MVSVSRGWGEGEREARFTIHKTTRWIELSERCGSCQFVPGSARAPTARICIIPFTSTILIGGLFQSLSPRIFALLLLSFLHTPLFSALPLSPNRRLVRLFSSNSFPLSLSFFLWRLDFTYPLHSSWFLVFFPFLCIYSWYALYVVVHHSFSWVVRWLVLVVRVYWIYLLYVLNISVSFLRLWFLLLMILFLSVFYMVYVFCVFFFFSPFR